MDDNKIQVAVTGAAAAVMTVITLVMEDSNNDDKYATLSTQLGELASAIKSLNRSSVDYSKLYVEVMKVDGYDEVTLGSVFDYLVEDEKTGKGFMVKSVNLKKVWIDKFLSKGLISSIHQGYILLSFVAKRKWVFCFFFLIEAESDENRATLIENRGNDPRWP